MDYALDMLREQRESASKARAQEIVERVKALHIAEYENGAMVRFTKHFSGGSTYTYLAIKADGRWFVTNKEVKGGYTDEQLEDVLAASLGFGTFERLDVTYVKPIRVNRSRAQR